MEAVPIPHPARVGLALCLAGAALGAVDLVGWMSRSDTLVSFFDERPPMMPNAGAAVVIAGIGAALRCCEDVPRWRKALSSVAGAAVLFIGAATLTEYLFHLDLRIDEILFLTETEGPFPGRPSLLTAFALTAFGAALLVFDVAGPCGAHPRQWLALTAGTIAFTTFLGHLYGAGVFFRIGGTPLIGVAIPTSVALFLLALGILLLRPDVGVVRAVLSPGPGGIILRRLGVASLFTPVVIGLLLTHAVSLVDEPLFLALMTTSMAVVGSAIVAIAARPLDRANAALEASRAEYRLLFEQAPDGVFVSDMDGRYTDINGAGCRLVQYRREELIGRKIHDLVLPEDIEKLARARANLLAGEINVAEWTLRRKDGSLVPVEVSAKIHRGGQWQAFVRDLTQRKASDAVLRRHVAEQEYLARVGGILASTLDYREMTRLFTEASVPFLGDVCGVLLEADDRLFLDAFHAIAGLLPIADYLRRFGAPKNGLLRRAFETKEPVLVAEIAPEDIRRVVGENENFRLLESLAPRSALAVPLLAHGRCHGAISLLSTDPDHRYGADDLRFVEAIGRKFALAFDNALLHEQLRLQGAIANHLSEGVMLLRVDDQTIVYTNPRMEQMFGYGPGELLGRHVSVINAPGDASPEKVAEGIAAQIQRTGAWQGEIEHVRKDGTTLWCYGSATAFDHPRFGPVYVSVHTDISERKRLEEERATALEEKEILLKEIHHRVKNNLQVISSLFYLQGRRTDEPQLRQLLDESRGRIQSIALVHEHLYRSENLAEIDFDEYVHSVVAGIEATYGSQKADIEVDAKGVFLDIEHAVPCGLLVSELVSNAFKHAFPDERRGTVRVRARMEEARRVALTVEDDGVELPPGVEHRKGQTLGFQLVQSLTAQLRGSLSLERDGGTRFIVRFPLPAEGPCDGRCQAAAGAPPAAGEIGMVK